MSGKSNIKPALAAFCLLAFGFVVTACSSAEFVPSRNRAAHYASEAGWRYGIENAGGFALARAFAPHAASADMRAEVLTIYIEGDGLAFVGSRRISADPTPTDPLALRLALNAPQARAAWLGRPCQYTLPVGAGRNCDPIYWTSHRYSRPVLDSMNLAVDQLKSRSGAARLILIGYSGGGAIAALLAAERQDIAGLITIAANLDLGEWVAREKLAPLHGSLDPAMVAGKLSALPQVHFVGTRDDVVPPAIARAFIARLGPNAPARLVEIPDFGHADGWAEAWPALLRRPEVAALRQRSAQ